MAFMSRCFLGLFVAFFAFSVSFAQDDEDADYDYLSDAEIEALAATTLEPSFISRASRWVKTTIRPNEHSTNFSQAKLRLYAYIGDETTLYCGCKTDLVNRTFDRDACGYVPQKESIRSKRTEAEHVLPAHSIAAYMPGSACWVPDDSCGSGRKCCEKNDPVFKKAHDDLVNLVPAIGEINSDRSNYPYDLIEGEKREYGQCDFELDRSPYGVEPRPEVRGDIARIYFYMRDTYGLVFPQDLVDRLEDWDADDPIDGAEKTRNRRIKRAQGSANPAIK